MKHGAWVTLTVINAFAPYFLQWASRWTLSRIETDPEWKVMKMTGCDMKTARDIIAAEKKETETGEVSSTRPWFYISINTRAMITAVPWFGVILIICEDLYFNSVRLLTEEYVVNRHSWVHTVATAVQSDRLR